MDWSADNISRVIGIPWLQPWGAVKLYPSLEWNAFCKSRNVFNCSYTPADNQDEFTLKTLCHYIQLLGDMRLRTVAERLIRHFIRKRNLSLTLNVSTITLITMRNYSKSPAESSTTSTLIPRQSRVG